jgi:hypothetical protein
VLGALAAHGAGPAAAEGVPGTTHVPVSRGWFLGSTRLECENTPVHVEKGHGCVSCAGLPRLTFQPCSANMSMGGGRNG